MDTAMTRHDVTSRKYREKKFPVLFLTKDMVLEDLQQASSQMSSAGTGSHMSF